MGPKEGLFWLGLSICIGYSLAQTAEPVQEGLYVSNATHILFLENGRGTPKSVFNEDNGRIVGMAVDSHAGKFFWSDIGYFTRGIYSADIARNGDLVKVKKEILEDIMEVNGIAVDYATRHLYFTDGKRRTVEVSNYQGLLQGPYRRTFGNKYSIPRGIAVDPVNGRLFWNDQGTGKIERSLLDGSIREVIVDDEDVQWPNQMVIQPSTNRVLWVDAMSKKILSSSMDGQSVKEEADLSAEVGINTIYGLALNGNTAYVSAWNGKVLTVDLTSGSVTEVTDRLGSDALFSVVYNSKREQPMPSQYNPCGRADHGGCSGGLCLPKQGMNYRCSCPSYGGKVLQADKSSCATPEKIMLYVSADDGEVGFIDLTDGGNSDERYIVGRSMRPVAVTYDPKNKEVYWSDVLERAIHVASLDGSNHRLFLTANKSLGIVEGLAMDYIGGRLYFTNMDMVEVQGATYSWHKIEAIGLDGKKRRTLVEDVEKPRGLFLDLKNQYLLYTDWGTQSKVVRVQFDGYFGEVLISAGIQNPNGVVVDSTRKPFVVDSFYKSRKMENGETFGPPKTGKLLALDGFEKTGKEFGIDVETPFGLSIDSNDEFYISDWATNSIYKYNRYTNQQSVVMRDVQGPMGVLVTEVTKNTDTDQYNCGTSTCDICFWGFGKKCTCDSYGTKTFVWSEKTCKVPTELLLIADFSSVHLRSLGRDKSLYNLVAGNTFTNIVSLVHDKTNGVVYFSDVNTKNIYKADIATGQTELFVETDAIIDGMKMNQQRSRLYWTDFHMGNIYYTNINTKETTRLVRGLDKPRAIVLDEINNYVYWSEWGMTPRVARARLSDGTDVTTLADSTVVTHPNGLDLDTKENKLYVGEAGNEHVMILECSLGNGAATCEPLPYTVDVPKHVYAIRKHGEQLYYTDWVASELAMIDMRSGLKISVVKNLMRPTDFSFNGEVDAACPSNNRCSDTCLPHLTGHTCTCPAGQKLTPDGRACTYPYTGEWSVVAAKLCTQSCLDIGAVCARKHSTTKFACVCREGYKLVNGKCEACEENMFQPFLTRAAECRACPGQSRAPSGARECKCSSGESWNHQTATCSELGKAGQCPTMPIITSEVSCEGEPRCKEEDCPGAQKCCQGSCQCQDPIRPNTYPSDLWDCVYEGRLYAVGETFKPEACITCSCLANSRFSSPLYGGATCRITDCPKLDCAETDYLVPDGECCPMCKSSQSRPVRITDCPQEARVYQLPGDSDMAEVDIRLSYSDIFHRQLTEKRSPPDRYFSWSGNDQAQDITVEVMAPKSNGDWDRDTCELQVIIRDESSPSVTCPSDIKLISTEIPAQVRWTPAQYIDNVCGQTDCAVSSVPAPDSPFSAGVTTVQYTVKDGAGNKGECSFRVEVVEPASPVCVPPMIYNGYLDCSSSGTCMVMCHAGYTVHRQSFVSCKDDVWSPGITTAFQHLACTKRMPQVSQGKVNARAESCPDSSHESFSSELRAKITSGYVGTMKRDVSVGVTSSGCSSRRRRDTEDMLKVEIVLEAPVNASLTSPLETLLNVIESDLESCDLWAEDTECKGVSASITPPTIGCKPGQEQMDNYCIECPVGTYEENGKCKLCGEDHYQGVAGQTSCKYCGPDMYSAEGSVFDSDCVEEKVSAETLVPIIIGAVVGGLVLIMIIVAICVCCRRGKTHGKYESTTNGASYHNNAYDAENAGEMRDGQKKTVEKRYSDEAKEKKENEYAKIIE